MVVTDLAVMLPETSEEAARQIFSRLLPELLDELSVDYKVAVVELGKVGGGSRIEDTLEGLFAPVAQHAHQPTVEVPA